MPTQDAEHREFKRFSIEFDTEIYVLEGVVRHYLETAKLRDVSGGGVCFFSTSPEAYAIGQRLFLSVRLPKTKIMTATIQGEAKVAWIGEREDDRENDVSGSLIGVSMDDPLTFERSVRDQEGNRDADGETA